MKAIINTIATIMGFFIALPIRGLISTLIFSNFKREPIIEIAALFVLGIIWISSSFLLIEKSKTIKKVLSLGFLFWASEWFCLALLSIVILVGGDLYSSIFGNQVPVKEVKETISSGFEPLFQTLGSFLYIGICFLMSLASVLGYTISILLLKELETND